MFEKSVLAATLVGSVFATGASAAAADFAQVESPPAPPRTAMIGDFSGAEPLATHGYVLRCSGWKQCEGLQTFCAGDGGHYKERELNGSVVGVCAKL